MLEGLLSGGKLPGWTVVALETGRLGFARGEWRAGTRPRLFDCGEVLFGDDAEGLEHAIHSRRLGRGAKTAALLAAGDYQWLLTEAPNVPPAELKAAMKWRIKDLVDVPVDDLRYDILDLPPPAGAPMRARAVFAVVAKEALLRGRVRTLEEAGVELAVIDVPETAQRNVSLLYEEEGYGTGLLYVGDRGALYTVTFRGELYLARRFDIAMPDILRAEGDARQAVFGRILAELQRTLDSFERQFGFIITSRVMVGPQPEDTGLLAYLNANLGMRAEAVDLGAVVDRESGVVLDAETQWRLFHPIGCSFRAEARAA